MMENNNLNNDRNARLRGNLSAFALTMSALAFIAPLGAVSGGVPTWLGLAGSGTTTIFIGVTIFLLVFSVGFTKMSLHMERPGGFYAFVTDGLGKKFGFVTAGMASVGYLLIANWCTGSFGIQLNALLGNVFGLPEVPWIIWTLLLIALSTFFAYRKVDVSAKVLVVVMVIEMIIVIAFDVLSLKQGFEAHASKAMFTGPLNNGKFGAALLMVLGAYFGFEATVIYREETRNPEKTIPRAVYATILVIGILWIVTCWAFTAFWGADKIEQICIERVGTVFYEQMLLIANVVVMDIVNMMALFSIFASILSIQNVAARYWYSLGVDGALPKKFGQVHPKHHSPSFAALVIGCILGGLMLILYIAGRDPETLYPLFSGTGTFFVTINLFLVSIAILAYFRKNKFSDLNAWNSVIAPIISVVFLGVTAVLAVIHFESLLGSSGWATYAFLAFVVAVFGGSYGYAAYLEKRKPDIYARLGRQNPDNIQ